MAQIEVTREIARPADEVWKAIGGFGTFNEWFPGIDQCDFDGKVRTLKTANGTLTERLHEQDDTERTQSYSIEEAPFPFESHRTTMSVREDGANSVLLFQVEITPDTMAPVMEAIYSSAADKAKEHAEGG